MNWNGQLTFAVATPKRDHDSACNSSSWIPLVAEFRTSTIAPLQEILAEIPQLKACLFTRI